MAQIRHFTARIRRNLPGAGSIKSRPSKHLRRRPGSAREERFAGCRRRGRGCLIPKGEQETLHGHRIPAPARMARPCRLSPPPRDGPRWICVGSIAAEPALSKRRSGEHRQAGSGKARAGSSDHRGGGRCRCTKMGAALSSKIPISRLTRRAHFGTRRSIIGS
jgi:hypothetical protein